MDLMPYAGEILSSGVRFWGTLLVIVLSLLAWLALTFVSLLVLYNLTDYTPPEPSRNQVMAIIELMMMPIILLRYPFQRRRV